MATRKLYRVPLKMMLMRFHTWMLLSVWRWPTVTEEQETKLWRSLSNLHHTQRILHILTLASTNQILQFNVAWCSPMFSPFFKKCHRFHMSHHLTSAPLWHYDVTVCHFSQLANQTVIVLTHSSQVFHLFTSFTDRRTAFFFRGFLAFFSAAVSQNDVIESADAAQPLAQRLAYASIRHVTGQLAEAGVERRLERQEGGIWQEQDLIEESQHHVGPRLQTERDTGTHDCTCEVLLL